MTDIFVKMRPSDLRLHPVLIDSVSRNRADEFDEEVIRCRKPSKRDTLTQYWFNAGPQSATLAQHQTAIVLVITCESKG